MRKSKTVVIKPKRHLLDVNLKELVQYKDLIVMFVKRDFISVYKQTVLGPFWFFIQPLLTSITFTIIFATIAGITTEGIPAILFYLGGLTLWNYFSNCLTNTANTFITNKHIFGKVYFPRLVIPISVTISGLFKVGIQLLMFFIFWIYHWSTNDIIQPNSVAFLLPILILLLAGLSLSMGIIVSSLTTKYRDFTFLLAFGVQLFMYATPIIYPSSIIPEKFQFLLKYNPVTPIIDTFKHGFLNPDKFAFEPMGLLYSFSVMVVMLFIGVVTFNKVEQKFMDTV
jgi:lipopolysaccharide transport system permease protein